MKYVSATPQGRNLHHWEEQVLKSTQKLLRSTLGWNKREQNVLHTVRESSPCSEDRLWRLIRETPTWAEYCRGLLFNPLSRWPSPSIHYIVISGAIILKLIARTNYIWSVDSSVWSSNFLRGSFPEFYRFADFDLSEKFPRAAKQVTMSPLSSLSGNTSGSSSNLSCCLDLRQFSI